MLFIPQNKIEKFQTKPGEWVLSSTFDDYNGFYVKYNNKFYTGKSLDNESREILKKDNEEVAFILSTDTIYNKNIKRNKSISNQFINTKPPTSINFDPNNYIEEIVDRYFLKQKDQIDFIKIIEVDSKTYNEYQSNTLYETAKIKWNIMSKFVNLELYEKEMGGLSSFLTQNATKVEDKKVKRMNVKYYGERIEGKDKDYE
jgi:hypothetical protein